MLLTTLLAIGTTQEPGVEPMKWVGEVKAFAYFASPACLPQENTYKFYAVRKQFEDGSTVTLVRTVPIDLPNATPPTRSEGIIERDREGVATYIATRRTQDFLDFTCQSEFTLDPKKGVLVGSGSNASVVSKDVVLPDPKAYVLDPLEALAFDPLVSRSAGWLLPSGTYGAIDPRSKGVGLQYVFQSSVPCAFNLAGQREMFRSVRVVSRWIGSSLRIPPGTVGNLLYRADGRFAAYIPHFFQPPGLPSSVWSREIRGGQQARRQIGTPPFPLSGKLAREWEDGERLGANLPEGMHPFSEVIVPATVSSKEKAALLSAIPDRPKAKSTDAKSELSGTSAPPVAVP